MRLYFSSLVLCSIIFLSFTGEQEGSRSKQIIINWTDEFSQDFSFRHKWSYPLGVYRNQYNQLSCDGFCPTEIDVMKAPGGRVIEDSLTSFYKIIDTTHINHSIKSDVKVYEYSGMNHIDFEKQQDGSIIGKTRYNASTHTLLYIKILNDSVTTWIDYNSIRSQGVEKFSLKKGEISLDKKLLENGIVKAEFKFEFTNTLDGKFDVFWNGLIYAPYK